MYREAILHYFVYNNELLKTGTQIENKIIDENKIIYEVIRVIDGVPLFLEEHLNRMYDSALILGYKINRSENDIIENIYKLINANNIKNMNIKLYLANIDTDNQDLFLYFVNSKYPDESLYINGVKTQVIHKERINPNAKIINQNLKDIRNTKLASDDIYEMILVNHNNHITEGSRSNLFFVKGDTVYSSKQNEVLNGITRKMIISMMKENNIKFIETDISEDELPNFDGAFLSGTSINILPIYSIDDIILDSVNNKMILTLIEGFNAFVNRYIENRRIL